MNAETRQTDIHAHIFQNPRNCKAFICLSYNITRAQATHCNRSSDANDRLDFRNGNVLVETNGSDVTWLLSWIHYHVSTVSKVVPLGSQKRIRRYARYMNDPFVFLDAHAN